MSRQYPVFNVINSCAYKQGNKSYGIRKHGDLTCYVGTSSTRSFKFFKTETTHKETVNGLHVYKFFVDGQLIKKAIYDYKLDEIEIETLTNN